jgi:hypothetical protein
MSDHWTDDLTHEQLVTPEAKIALAKYPSSDEALIGGLNAMKAVGKPFRLPKSLESLPDDTVRQDFTSQVGRLMGAIESEEDIADVNFAEGLADARNVNPELVTAFKKFAVDNKLPKSLISKLVGFNNQFATQILNQQAQVRTETATKTNETLKVLYGGDEGVKAHTEMVKRLFKDHAGLTAEEYEQSAQGLITSGITQDAVLCKALFNLAKDIVPEAQTEGVEQTKKTEETESTTKDQMPKTAKALGWT